MTTTWLACLYVAVGIALAIRTARRASSHRGRQAIAMGLLWPLLAPFVLLAETEASEDEGAG